MSTSPLCEQGDPTVVYSNGHTAARRRLECLPLSLFGALRKHEDLSGDYVAVSLRGPGWAVALASCYWGENLPLTDVAVVGNELALIADRLDETPSDLREAAEARALQLSALWRLGGSRAVRTFVRTLEPLCPRKDDHV